MVSKSCSDSQRSLGKRDIWRQRLLALVEGNQRFKIDLSLLREELRYLEKWLVIAVLIGLVSGFGAVLFHYAIDYSTELFLGRLANYYPPKPGEPSPTFILPDNRLAIVVSLTIGGLLSGFIVFRFAPEAEGHGTDAAIDAFHYKEGVIRARVPLIKLLASAITIGSGGSAGKEGPVAQIGGGFGSVLADILKLNPRDRRIALAIGLGSGIGAIFKAPLGGTIFASEVLYLMDFEPYVIPPALIASLVGYTIVGYYTGWTPIFWTPSMTSKLYKLHEPITLAFFILLGLLNGILGILYVKVFYGMRDIFARLRLPKEIKPAIGGFLAGLIGVFYPQILESSYGWLQLAISGDFTQLPLQTILALPLLKMLATAFSIGSGGSGGVFAPSLVIGGSLGALMWHLAYLVLPNYDVPPAAYVVIGMMSFFGGVGKVPIATILMVGEMTGTYELLTPSLIATAVSYIIMGRNSIYESQVFSRAESPAHGESKIGAIHTIYEKLRLEEPGILYEVKARDLMVKPRAKILYTNKVEDILTLIKSHPYRVYPVVHEKDRFLGFITLEDIILVLKTRSTDLDIMLLPIHKGVTVDPEESLNDILRKMIEYEVDKVAVVDKNHILRGIITAKEILRYLAFKKVPLKK